MILLAQAISLELAELFGIFPPVLLFSAVAKISLERISDENKEQEAAFILPPCPGWPGRSRSGSSVSRIL